MPTPASLAPRLLGDIGGTHARFAWQAHSYQLVETQAASYADRTKRNVRESDATLILNAGPLEGGTLLTQRVAAAAGKPCLVARLDSPYREGEAQRILEWLGGDALLVLNVAGPREQSRPGVYDLARAMMRMLDREDIALEGRHAVVVGRSSIVGKPAAVLLLARHATVTICHSRTPELARYTRDADILVAAVGKAQLIKGDMIKPGAVVIDVGMNRLPHGKLAGDVDYESCLPHAGWITPVPGGVGPMTVAMLIENTVTAAERTA